MTYNNSKSEPREQSIFNMAVMYLGRLNQLLYLCNQSAMALDAYTWYHALVTLRRELSTEMKTEEIVDTTKMQKEIYNLLATRIKSTKAGTSQMTPQLHEELDNYEIFLRSILRTSGLQNKMKEDPSFAF